MRGMLRELAHADPEDPMRDEPCPIKLTALLAVLVGLSVTAPVRANPIADILACTSLDFSSCPALLAIQAKRAASIKELADVLRDASAPPVHKVRASQALSLLDARDEKDAIAAAAQALRGDALQIDVLVSAARLGDVRAVRPLLETLQQKDPRARILAAGALALLKSREAVPALVQALQAEDQPRLQAAAAYALGLIGDVGAEADLLALAAKPRIYVPTRVQALDALASLHSKRAVVLATMLIDSASRDIGRAALRLLTAVPTPWTEPCVVFALETPGLRGEAGRAVDAMGLVHLGQKLIATVVRDDLEPEERQWLLNALTKMKPHGAAPALTRRLKATQDAEEKLRILRALPEFGDRTIVPDLILQLQSDDRALVNQAVFALESLTGRNLGGDVHAWQAYEAGAAQTPPLGSAIQK